MGRLSEYFNQHRDNVEEAVAEVLKKADSTIESLDGKVKELERKLRNVAGDNSEKDSNIQQNDDERKPEGVVTSEQVNETSDESVAAQADKVARSKRNR